MNFLIKAITFLPNLRIYLKGVVLFNKKHYDDAIMAFEKCINHPSLNSELLYSYYGQSLCSVGRLEEAYLYLVKAAQLFESEGWLFEDDQIFNLANNTIAALKHVGSTTDLKINESLLNAELKMKNN